MMKSITLFLVLLGYCAAVCVPSGSSVIQLSREVVLYFRRVLQNIQAKQQLALNTPGKDGELLLYCVAFDLASYVSQLSLELKVDIAVLMTQMGLSQSVQDTVKTILRAGIIPADLGPGGAKGLVSELLPAVTSTLDSILSGVFTILGSTVAIVTGLLPTVLGPVVGLLGSQDGAPLKVVTNLAGSLTNLL